MADTDIRRTVNAVEAGAERVIKRLAFAINNELKRTTPVDTGWARANWVPSVGRPAEGVTGSRDAVNTGAQSAGEARLLVYTLSQSPEIWITNNVPYIGDLNAGRSPQAPANFIETAIDTAIASIIGGTR